MSAQGVFTRMKRVRFVPGQETYNPDPGFVACGDGTGFPMLVTLNQIAEIFYRVKDAWWTGGELTWHRFGSDISFSPPAYMPANRVYEANNTYQDFKQARGYAATDNQGGYADNNYDAGLGNYYYDVGNNERSLWYPSAWNGDPNPQPWNTWTFSTYWTHPIVNAFSFVQDDSYNTDAPPDTSWWSGTANAYGGVVEVKFGGRVAVVKTDPANGFFDPTNKFYLEFVFHWFDTPPIAGWSGSTNIYSDELIGYPPDGDWSVDAVVQCNYIIRLSSSDVVCPIYFKDDGSTSIGGSDIIHEATEWWPYKRLAIPVSIWDSATGEPIPVGAPTLDFSIDDNTDQIFNLI